MNLLHVLLVDDHPVVRMGLAALIRTVAPMAQIAEAATPLQMESALAQQVPQLTLLDIHLSDADGLTLVAPLQRAGSKVLVLSIRDEWSVMKAAMNAGADGYLVKDAAGADLANAMDTVLNGRIYIAPRWRDRWNATHTDQTPHPLDGLSPREQQVLWLVGQGLGKTAIGERLGISPNTAETHRQKLRQKLQLANQHELVKFALRYAKLELPMTQSPSP